MKRKVIITDGNRITEKGKTKVLSNKEIARLIKNPDVEIKLSNTGWKRGCKAMINRVKKLGK